VGDGRVPLGFVDKARLAIANCPELAIEIIED
jgi:ferredoxin